MLSDPAYKQQFQVDLTRMPPTAVGGLFRSCLSVAPVVGKDLKYPLTLIVGFLGEEEAHFVGGPERIHQLPLVGFVKL